MLTLVKGDHCLLRCYPLLFCKFKQFNIRAALGCHLVIQKEDDELLAKGAIEPSTDGAALYTLMSLCYLSILVCYELILNHR